MILLSNARTSKHFLFRFVKKDSTFDPASMDSYSSHKILPELNLIVTNHQGKIKMTDLIRSTKLFMEDDLYDAGMNVLIDFRDSVAISYRMELLELIDFVKKSVRLPHLVKICVFYSSPNQEFLLTVYKPMARLMNMEVEKFKDLESGLDWLGFDDIQKNTVTQTLRAIKQAE